MKFSIRGLLISFIVVSLLSLFGCQNTAKGFDEDTQKNVQDMRNAINS